MTNPDRPTDGSLLKDPAARRLAAPAGRLDAATLLGAAAHRAMSGPEIVQIVGEAGIGKTHLIDHLEQLAHQRGFNVRRGRASEFERDTPFATIIDALRGTAHGLGDDAAPEHRHELHRTIRGLLEAEAQRTPLMLVVDDLHWADPATIGLITSLVGRAPEAPFMLVVAYRPRQIDTALSPALQRALGSTPNTRIELGPIAVDAVASLLQGDAPRQEVEALHRACGGNPFHLLQLGRTGDATAALAEHVASTKPIQALLESELEPLPEAAQRLAHAAAVAGDPFEIGLAGAIADMAENDLLGALDTLAAADLIRPTASARWFQFRHPLVRQAVYESVLFGSRLGAHGRAASALRAGGAGPSALAHHVEQSAPYGDREAVATLTEAGKQVAARSPGSAAHWFGAAWRLLPAQAHMEQEGVDLLYSLGLSLLVSGNGERALELTSTTLESLPVDDPLRLRFELGIASINEGLGQWSEAREKLEWLEALIHPARSVEAFAVALSLGALACALTDLPTAELQVQNALAIADEFAYPPLRGLTMAVGAWVSLWSGDVPEALVRCDAAAATFDEIWEAAQQLEPSVTGSLAEMELFPSLGQSLVVTELGLGRFDDAHRHAEHVLIVTRKGSFPMRATVALSVQALTDLARGRLRDAADHADAATEEAGLVDHREATLWAFSARCAVLEPTDQSDRAIEAGERALAAARSHGLVPFVAFAGYVLARALLAADLPVRAIEIIESTHGGEGLPHASPDGRPAACRLLCEAELRRGDGAAAARWAVAARSASDTSGLPLARVDAAAAQAACALAAGDAATAAALASTAVAAATAAGANLEAARLTVLEGRAVAAAGDPATAESILRSAEATLGDMGATRLQRLADLARGSADHASGSEPEHTVAVAEHEPLTARQREIASLAAAGHTNREIAETLVVSMKTVESHLSAVYTKLHVGSRRELRQRYASVPIPR